MCAEVGLTPYAMEILHAASGGGSTFTVTVIRQTDTGPPLSGRKTGIHAVWSLQWLRYGNVDFILHTFDFQSDCYTNLPLNWEMGNRKCVPLAGRGTGDSARGDPRSRRRDDACPALIAEVRDNLTEPYFRALLDQDPLYAQVTSGGQRRFRRRASLTALRLVRLALLARCPGF